MFHQLLASAALFLLFTSCQTTPKSNLPQGKWRAAIQLQGQEVPFFIQFEGEGEQLKAYLLNSDEKLETDVLLKEDSIIMEMNVFDASLRGKLVGDTLRGHWVKHYVQDYRAPFEAAPAGKQQRFKLNGEPEHEFSGKWETYFNLGSSEPRPALGNFDQEGNQISGSFALGSGDFRYLEGNVSGNKFYLSTFNGEEAKLFIGELDDSGKVKGKYFSGLTGNYSFEATRNEGFELAQTGREIVSQEIDFTYPDLSGKNVSLSDPQFHGKPVIVQIFGSWCPNCMDETKYFGRWYEDHKTDIEIVALAFEQKEDFNYAKGRVEKSKERLGANYTFLIAGQAKKANEAFPTIEEPIYFPTTLYIDKKGRLRKVHAGFNGPSTGALFEQWKAEHQAIVEKLLEE